MKTIIALTLFCASIIQGGEILSVSDRLSPEDLNIFKWEFRQKTDAETGAVMRVEHKIAGIVIEKYDVVIFDKEKENLGSLLVFNGEEPPRVKLPDGNVIRPRHVRRLGGVSHGSEAIKGIDGIERDARFVYLMGDQESLRISFFAAPFSIYRKVLKDLPSTTDGKVSGFWSTYRMVTGDQISISTKIVDGKEVVSASVVPQATDAEQADPKPTEPNPAKE